jgi:hypothetical protein
MQSCDAAAMDTILPERERVSPVSTTRRDGRKARMAGLPLTPDIIAGAYEFLRVTPPFRGWKLPHANDVEFVVSRHRTHVAYHRGLRRKTRSHEIGISEICVGHTETLLRAMAHEMIHQYQQRARSETPHTEHNAEFLKLARQVCRYHGWDEKEFL